MPVLVLPRVDFEAGARLAVAGLVAAVVVATVGLGVVLGRVAAPPAHLPLMRAVALPGVASSPEPPHEIPAAPVPHRRPAAPSKAASPRPSPAAARPVAAPPPAAPVPPVPPSGKGVWIWEPTRTDGGDAAAIVARATATGLTHIYVRTGSGWDGLQNGPFLDALLPVAHAAGLKVYGWDFPKLETVADDIDRAMATITHLAPGGHRLDGFAADIETPHEGTRLSVQAAQIYGSVLRARTGASELLIAVVPRPSPQMLQRYPYADVVAHFDVIAPMIYWLNREPGSDVADAMKELARYAKPLAPIGQAYDGAPEGGRTGVPPRAELLRFMEVAAQYHAAAVSFWSWQEANDEAWTAIHDAPWFKLDSPRR